MVITEDTWDIEVIQMKVRTKKEVKTKRLYSTFHKSNNSKAGGSFSILTVFNYIQALEWKISSSLQLFTEEIWDKDFQEGIGKKKTLCTNEMVSLVPG